MIANINLPRILRVGAGASRELAATLAELQLARPLLVTDPFMVTQGYCARLLEPLAAAGIHCGVFDSCVPDPTTDSVEAALAVYRAGDFFSGRRRGFRAFEFGVNFLFDFVQRFARPRRRND